MLANKLCKYANKNIYKICQTNKPNNRIAKSFVFTDWIVGTGLYVIVVLIGSLVLTGLLHALDTHILCLIFKKPVPKALPEIPEFMSCYCLLRFRHSLSIFYLPKILWAELF